MIRISEAVLPGHPDKLCDFVAESIMQAAVGLDPEAYAQIEAGIWCDQLWLSGGYAVRGKGSLEVARLATGALDAIARAVDPRRWSRHVNDQAIVIGWAGYDAKLRHLPPEHFLALAFRDALWEACCGGELARCGPDGKLIVRLREDAEGFLLEHVLVTLEHPEALGLFDLATRINAVLAAGYAGLRRADRRWLAPWREVEVLVNPNGPLSDAGSRKDNGQTGRKLVMDYYGPRVPLDVQVELRGTRDLRMTVEELTLCGGRGIAPHSPPSARVPLDWVKRCELARDLRQRRFRDEHALRLSCS